MTWGVAWWELGHCQDVSDPNVFHKPRSRSSGASELVADRWHQARDVCHGCPVIAECLEFVLDEEVLVIGHGGQSFAAGRTPSELSQLRSDRERDADGQG